MLVPNMAVSWTIKDEVLFILYITNDTPDTACPSLQCLPMGMLANVLCQHVNHDSHIWNNHESAKQSPIGKVFDSTSGKIFSILIFRLKASVQYKAAKLIVCATPQSAVCAAQYAAKAAGTAVENFWYLFT